MTTPLSDTERERVLERILRAAAAVVYAAHWVDLKAASTAPIELAELAAALDALPLVERERYGV